MSNVSVHMQLLNLCAKILQASALAIGIVALVGGVFVSLLAGAMPQGEPHSSPWLLSLFTLLLVCLISGGYFFIGIWGRTISTSLKLKLLGTFILVVQCSLIVLFAFAGNLWSLSVKFLLFFSVLLFFVFIWPTWGNSTLTHHSSGTPNGAP